MNTLFFSTMGQLFSGGVASGFRGSVVDLIIYSGPVVKIVLLILLFFSIFSWAIIFSKLRLIRLADRESKSFLRIFWEGKQFASIFAESKKLHHSPTAEIFRAAYLELTKLSQAKANPDNPRKNSDPAALSMEMTGVDNISRAMRQALTSELTKLERASGSWRPRAPRPRSSASSARSGGSWMPSGESACAGRPPWPWSPRGSPKR